MEIKAIRTEADYLAALREVSALIDLDPATDAPEELKIKYGCAYSKLSGDDEELLIEGIEGRAQKSAVMA